MANKFCALIVSVIIIFSGSAGYCDDKLNIAVSHPWLALLASFIGGAEVNITPLRIWNANGDLIKTERGRAVNNLPDKTKIIALDEKDSEAAGINNTNKTVFEIKFLYAPFPVSMKEIFDPSVIPFVAQRVLTVLSEWDAQNYPYYQRRLAEFQARLSSAILVGQVLRDSTICDLSGSAGVMLMASGCKIIKPENLSLWEKGNFSGLADYLENLKAQGIIIVIDDDTPSALKKYLSGRSEVFKWNRPSLASDYPTFLNEQYISLWQKIIAKPLPSRKR